MGNEAYQKFPGTDGRGTTPCLLQKAEEVRVYGKETGRKNGIKSRRTG